MLLGSCFVFYTFVIDAALIPSDIDWAQGPSCQESCT